MKGPFVSLSPAPAGERVGVRGTRILSLLLTLAACGVKAPPRPPEPAPRRQEAPVPPKGPAGPKGGAESKDAPATGKAP